MGPPQIPPHPVNFNEHSGEGLIHFLLGIIVAGWCMLCHRASRINTNYNFLKHAFRVSAIHSSSIDIFEHSFLASSFVVHRQRQTGRQLGVVTSLLLRGWWQGSRQAVRRCWLASKQPAGRDSQPLANLPAARRQPGSRAPPNNLGQAKPNIRLEKLRN